MNIISCAKVITICLLTLFAGSCGSDDDDNSIGLENITISNFPKIDGSDSTTPLRNILMCKLLGFGYEWQQSPFVQFSDEAPWFVRPNYTCTEDERHAIMGKMQANNTHQSFVNLIDNKVELILTARGISRDEKDYANEKGVTLIEKKIAKDALTFIVNPSNPVNSLTVEQIQAIYTGDITRWDEVGGKAETMTPYVRNRNSGSQEKFETMVMAGLKIKEFPEMQIGHTMMTPYYQIQEDKTGIAFTPFYYYSVIVANETVKGLAVNGVAMTKENIINATYPYISDVYAAVRSDIDRTSPAYRIFEFLTAKGGQKIIAESGYIPLAAYKGEK